jgi:hypothetical protein
MEVDIVVQINLGAPEIQLQHKRMNFSYGPRPRRRNFPVSHYDKDSRFSTMVFFLDLVLPHSLLKPVEIIFFWRAGNLTRELWAPIIPAIF